MTEQDLLTTEDVRTVIKYLSGGLGDLRLITVTCSHTNPSERGHPGIRSSLELSEVSQGIDWLAVRDSPRAETFLFMSLYAEKFAKLVRKWNTSGSRVPFDMIVEPISATDAFTFYQSATFKAENLLRAVIRSLKRRNR